MLQGRQAMGDDKDGAPNAKTLHYLDNFSFRFYIDGACRLIEDENGSILREKPVRAQSAGAVRRIIAFHDHPRARRTRAEDEL